MGPIPTIPTPKNSPVLKGISSSWRVVGLIALVVLVFHLPGSMTQDSMYVLRDAIKGDAGRFDEWYSPAYTLIWSLMIQVTAGLGCSPLVQIGTMCVLQTVLVIAALVGLVRAHVRTGWRSAAALALIVASPTIFIYLGVLWRDVLMAALLLGSVYLLDSFSRTASKRTWAAALTVLFVASLVRHNCIIAELPLFLWAGSLLYPGKRKYARAVLSICVPVFLFASGGTLVTRLLAKTSLGLTASGIMYYDLMGISVRTGELLMPKSLILPDYSLETAKALYQDEYEDLTGVTLPTDERRMRIVSDAWRRAVVSHPAPYLAHRMFVMLRFLGISNQPHLPYAYGIPDSLYPSYIEAEVYRVKFPMTPIRAWYNGKILKAGFWIFRLWIYGLLTAIVLFARRKSLGTPFWLCASGGVYLASYFFVCPSTDFRYGWWTALAAMVGAVLCIFGADSKLAGGGQDGITDVPQNPQAT